MPRTLAKLFHGFTLALVAMAATLLSAPHASAQIGQERLYQFFNFEERDKGNWEDLPMNWYIIGRTAETSDPNFASVPLHKELTARLGFPAHNMDIRFDTRAQVSGQHSLYLGVEGGNAGAFLGMGTVPVVPMSDYLVNAKVRTTNLKHATARVVAYFIDEHGKRIESTVATSPPLVTNGAWTDVTLRMPGESAHAVWLGMEVLLLQPSTAQESPLGKHQIVYSEARGGAWFDDIGVWQLPRATLTTQTPTNLIRFPEQPSLTVKLRDLSSRPIFADVSVYDHTGKLASQARRAMGRGEPQTWNWRPNLPALGWYLAELYVRETTDEGERVIAHEMGSLVWMPGLSDAASEDQERFTLDGEHATAEELLLLPEVMKRAELGSLVLSVWDRSTLLSTLEERQSSLSSLLDWTMRQRKSVTMSLSPVPEELRRAIDVDRESPLPMVALPAEKWLPYLSPVMLRQGQAVAAWQLGSSVQPDVFFIPNLPALLNAARMQLVDHAPSPRTVLPWRLDQARRADVSATGYAMLVPTAVRPAMIPDYLAEWNNNSNVENIRLDFETTPADRLTHERRITDLAERMVYAWSAGAPAMLLRKPWAVHTEQETQLMPDPALGVFSNISSMLAARRYLGRMPIADGVECLIFNGANGGMLVAWNRWASEKDAAIDMVLGNRPIATDVFGNRTALTETDGRHQWKLGNTPVFFTGIDPMLALFRSTFHVTPREIESTQELHTRILSIENPWPVTMTGTITLVDPANWKLQPQQTTISIPARSKFEMPIQIMFPVSEIAGAKRLTARFDFMADRRYSVLLSTPMEIGLKNVRCDDTLGVETNPKTGKTDIIVTQLITNTGETPISLQAFAQLPGFPRQEKLVSALRPGQSVVRRFRFEGAEDAVRERGLRAGLREANGPAVLNRILHLTK